MRRILLVLAACLFATAANAQLVTKAPSLYSTGPCTPTSCTGFYVGGMMAGNGTNADIVGSGLSGSVFAGGGIPSIVAGYQFANGVYFAAAEVSIGWQIDVNTNTVASGAKVANTTETGYMAFEGAKVGMQFAGILGSQSAPIGIPTALAARLISPYIIIGAVERPFANGWSTGAGATFDLSPTLFLDIRYMYINYGAGAVVNNIMFPSENLVSVGLNYKFGF